MDIGGPDIEPFPATGVGVDLELEVVVADFPMGGGPLPLTSVGYVR
jgi:hypothetical protein